MTKGGEAARLIRIAAAQYPIEQLATLGAYRDKISRWVAEAARAGAQLLVFPEYGAMEYGGAFGAATADLTASLELVAQAMIDLDACHAELARTYGVHILAASGPMRRTGGGYTNAARLYAPSGRSGRQDKRIMTPFERDWGISAGERLEVFETTLGVIAIAICYDSEFPLLVRAQAEAGAEVVLIPSCTERISGFSRVRTAALARALENSCACVQSPTVGDAVWSPAVDRNYGSAGVFVPAEQGLSDTGVVAEGVAGVPGWVYGSVDLTHLQRIRTTGEMRNNQDWALQPGAAPLGAAVHRVDLR